MDIDNCSLDDNIPQLDGLHDLDLINSSGTDMARNLGNPSNNVKTRVAEFELNVAKQAQKSILMLMLPTSPLPRRTIIEISILNAIQASMLKLGSQ